MDNQLENNSSLLFCAGDADDAGKKVGRAILADNPDELKEVSDRINLGQEVVRNWVEENGGSWISGGGDEFIANITQESADLIEQLRKDYQFATGLTLSVGIGSKPSEAGKALLVAKFRGKNQVVRYDESIEKEIESAQERVASGSGSHEENKLSEAYLKPAGQDKFADSDSSVGDNGDKPSYKEMDVAPPAIDKPNPDEQPKQGLGPSMDVPEKDRKMNEVDPAPEDKTVEGPKEPSFGAHSPNEPDKSDIDSSLENQKDMLDDMEEKNPSPEKDIDSSLENQKDLMDHIDTNAMMNHPEMDENCSRPDGFEDKNVPGDLGLNEEDAEASPDLSEVLEQGLDNHAEAINKEKVIDMVSVALEGFKANKEILEKAKERAPELYNSCISMLKAMIEMAKMLGLGQEQSQPSEEAPQEAPSEEPKEDATQPKSDPAAPQEGAASFPKEQSQ